MTTGTILCANKGCGKSFAPDDNAETACEYHPGAPVFHDALKGWSCCSKKVTDFNDFLKIAGCTVGPHSAAAPATDSEPASKAAPPKSVTTAPTQIIDGKEVYGTAPTVPAPTSTAKPATTVAAASPPAKPEVKEEDLHDAPDVVVAVGTACKRRACKHSFAGPESKEDECVFHPGVPVFHEGSKGWSCCTRKVLEFDEFLKLQGCKRGKHRFTDPVPAAEEKVECRRDWYQTQSTVIVTIFAKKVDKTQTTVTFGENQLTVRAKFLDGKVYELDTPLGLPIVPAESKFTVMSTKIEIVLKKANGLSWPTLEPAEGVVSWTTFGVSGGTGTVGSKVAVIAEDAPIHLLKK
ncbi:HSP20-like chaperone [Zopfochytrium polystomum]|nr:HSP20-like chaperone [Zopfochytrium polystomum]